MYERIFGRGNLAVLNRTLANAQLDIQLDDITIHIVWLSYSHYTRPPEKQEVTRSAPHRHSFFEMHLFLQGGSVYQAREAEYAVQAGELLFLGKEVPHQFLDGTPEWDKISLAFNITSRSSTTVARALKALTFSDALVTRYDPAILISFNDILNEADAQEPCYLEAIKARLLTIIIALVRMLSARMPKTAADKGCARSLSHHDYPLHRPDAAGHGGCGPSGGFLCGPGLPGHICRVPVQRDVRPERG